VGHESDRKIPDGLYGMATELLDGGASDAEVEQRLVAAGASPETARTIIAEQQHATVAVQSSEGNYMLWLGVVLLAVTALVILQSGPGYMERRALVIGVLAVGRGLYQRRRAASR
jgi:hypothetical protein